MQIHITFAYTVQVVPPRCRKPRDEKRIGEHVVTIREVSAAEAPVAIRATPQTVDRYGEPIERTLPVVEYRWDGEHLYTRYPVHMGLARDLHGKPVQAWAMPEEKIVLARNGPLGRVEADWIQASAIGLYLPNEPGLQPAVAQIEAWAAQRIIVAGEIYVRAREPVYRVQRWEPRGRRDDYPGYVWLDVEEDDPQRGMHWRFNLAQTAAMRQAIAARIKAWGTQAEVSEHADPALEVIEPAAIRATPGFTGLGLADALAQATRQTQWGERPDPVAQDLMRYPEDVTRLARTLEAAPYDLAVFRPLGAGASSIVFEAAGGLAVRLGLGPVTRRPPIDEMLQVKWSGTQGALRYEVCERADTAGITEADVEKMQQVLAARGMHLADPGTDNLGRVKGRLVVIDPGAIGYGPVPKAKGKGPRVELLVGDNGDQALFVNGKLIDDSQSDCGDADCEKVAERLAQALGVALTRHEVAVADREDDDWGSVYASVQAGDGRYAVAKGGAKR